MSLQFVSNETKTFGNQFVIESNMLFESQLNFELDHSLYIYCSKNFNSIITFKNDNFSYWLFESTTWFVMQFLWRGEIEKFKNFCSFSQL